MVENNNKIRFDGDGNIILQDVNGRDITINYNDTTALKELLFTANQNLINEITIFFEKNPKDIDEYIKHVLNNFNKIPPEIIKEKEKLIFRMDNLTRRFEKLHENYTRFWKKTNPCTNGNCFDRNEWNKLFNSIESGDCVLFVGQDISINEDKKSLHEIFNLKLHEHLRATGVRYLKNDGFFTPKIEDEKSLIEYYYGEITRHPDYITKKFVEENKVGERILTKLAHIPFSLILTVAPDNTQEQIHNNLGINSNSTFFKGEKVDLKKPTKKEPLLYYLIGKPDGKFANYIYQHKQLYEYIKKIHTPGLPGAIQEKLKSATHFLFIGFDFHKWHNQLLLYLVENYPKDSKTVFRRCILNSDILPELSDLVKLSIDDLKIVLDELINDNTDIKTHLFEILNKFEHTKHIVIDKKNQCAYLGDGHTYDPDELKLLIKDQFNISFINDDFEEFVDSLVYRIKKEDSGDLFINHAESFINTHSEIIKNKREKLTREFFDGGRGKLIGEIGESLCPIEDQTERMIKQHELI